jgi:uncharacterized protein with von Willebrand factor type A (vWA) domain
MSRAWIGIVEMEMAPLRNAVHIGGEDFLAIASGRRSLSEVSHLNERAETMLDELAWWAHTLRRGRDIPSEVVDRIDEGVLA